MIDFLLFHYSSITITIELIAAITGVFYYKRYKSTAAKYFIFFLVYLSICDSIGSYTIYVRNTSFLNFLIGTKIEKNHWWFTIFWKIGAIMFFAFYYRKILILRQLKDIIKYTSYSFLLISVIYIISHFDEFFYKFFPLISVLGAVIVFLCTVFYFLEILQSDKILTFYKSINFYISAAIFIWWLIITPIVFYDIYGGHRDIIYIQLRRYIYLLANIVMYLTFTFALIWCSPQKE